VAEGARLDDMRLEEGVGVDLADPDVMQGSPEQSVLYLAVSMGDMSPTKMIQEASLPANRLGPHLRRSMWDPKLMANAPTKWRVDGERGT